MYSWMAGWMDAWMDPYRETWNTYLYYGKLWQDLAEESEASMGLRRPQGPHLP